MGIRTPGWLAAVVMGSAAAQTPPPETIERITVTATRQDAALLQLPSNLGWLTHDTIDFVQHQHINQLMVRIPGAWISRGNGQEHLTALRSPVLTGAGACGAFFMAEDGISLRAPGFCNVNQLFDANTEQAGGIEVLRGPASTLYGSNAVHGVIDILSPDAFFAPRLRADVDAGPNDYWRGKLGIAGQSDTHAFLVYGNAAHDGGYKHESGFDQHKLNLVHQYQGEAVQVKSMLSGSNLNQDTAGFIQGFDAYKDEQRKRDNPNPEAFRDAQSLRAYSRVDYFHSDLLQFSLTPYLRWNEMEFLRHFLPWQPLEENGHHSLGMQAQVHYQGETLSTLLGVDWDYTEAHLRETQAEPFSPTLPRGAHYRYDVTATSYSPYAQWIGHVGEATQWRAGLRFDHTEYDYDNRLSDGDACAIEVENCRITRPTDQTVSYNEWSYQLGVNHAWLPTQAFYLQYSNGFRAPQASELFRLQAGQVVADLDTEQIEALELGFRGQWQALFYDLTLFLMEKDNFIFQDSDRQNISDGETSHRGAELSLSYTLPAGLYLAANGSYARHKYQSNLTLSRERIKGNDVDTAPRWTGSVQLGWFSEQGHRAELEWVHLGDYYLDPENSAEYPGHDLVNLRSHWAISEQLAVSFRVVNLTDEDYAERADFAFGNYRYFVGEPRSLFVGVHYQTR